MVIVATGTEPYWPAFERGGELQVVDAWQVLRDEVQIGRSVVVVDWRCDWIGPGIAERLTRAGHQVQLAVNGTHCGENLPLYVRDQLAGELHRLGIPITPYARLYGCDDNTVYLQHTASGEPMLLENIDTLVLCQGHQPVDTLGAELQGRVEFREQARSYGVHVRPGSELTVSNNSNTPPAIGTAEPHFLGSRIRGLRKRRGMTLAELAQLSELTAGYISQLERNLAYPSIPALFNIARSLGVTIQWFFASEANTAPEDDGVVVRKNSRLSEHYEDGIVDQLLTPPPNRQLEMLHSRFRPAPIASKATATKAKKPVTCCPAVSNCGSASATFSSTKATASAFPARNRTAMATLAR